MPNVGGGTEKHCHKFLVEMLIGFKNCFGRQFWKYVLRDLNYA